MNPDHLPRIQAVLALPLAARKALWALNMVPGWCYWLESIECRTCEGTTHEECQDCDDRRSDHEYVDALGERAWGSHCTCPDGESWPCHYPRCEPCGGTGWLGQEWVTNGLGVGGGMVSVWQRKTVTGKVPDDDWYASHLWLPYSPTDVLGLVEARRVEITLGDSTRILAAGALHCSQCKGGGFLHLVNTTCRPCDGTGRLPLSRVGPEPLLVALDVLGRTMETP
jgi:hypothetical protein